MGEDCKQPLHVIRADILPFPYLWEGVGDFPMMNIVYGRLKRRSLPAAKPAKE